eukprot:9728112-Heterocapsa_arctica.AAC.1
MHQHVHSWLPQPGCIKGCAQDGRGFESQVCSSLHTTHELLPPPRNLLAISSTSAQSSGS